MWVQPRLERIDAVRHPGRDPAGFKEWMHFCIYADGAQALVNFSQLYPTPAGPPRSRLTVIARDDAWQGDVVSIEPEAVTVTPGAVDLAFGPHGLRYHDGVYRVWASLPHLGFRIDARLEPVTHPSLIQNVDVRDGPPINWLVVPRLRAAGTLWVRDRPYPLEGQLAYHDHNWGRFRWGRNFAWEWGYLLPSDPGCPWTAVFVRLSDRALTRVMMQGLFLWRDRNEVRMFRGRELAVTHRGLLRPSKVHKVPAVMAFIDPSGAPGIPRELDVRAQSRGDHVQLRFRGDDVSQVLVPNDDDLGTTVINEVAGELELEGTIRGEAVGFRARSIFEFLGT